MHWLVIGGTSESVEAAAYLTSKGTRVTVSVATDMGAALYDDFSVKLWVGYLNREQFTERMLAEKITHVLDASHPFAVEVTRTVKAVCQALGLAYFRYTRRDAMAEAPLMPEIYRVADGREAARWINRLPGHAALLTGVKTLDIYRDYVIDFQQRCYARVLDNEASKARCREMFEDENHWQAKMPPFDVEANRRFLRDSQAKILVTKDSGAAGGLPEKLEAARLEGVVVILIRRPEERDILESLDRLEFVFGKRNMTDFSKVSGMPRLMIGGTQSGCGKTTVTAAVLQALTARGMKLAPYKCGPDYIDPMFHRRITGAPSINLDSVFLEPEKMRQLFAFHMRKKDMALVEGVMGYYDGQADSDRGSSYHVAAITKTPAVLVVRPEGTALSAAAMIQGFKGFRKDSMIRGVIFNGIREGMYDFYRKLVEVETGLKVYGFLPKDLKVSLESRHLGLVTAVEQERLSDKLEMLGGLAEKYLDLDGLITLANGAEPMENAGFFDKIAPVGHVRLAVAMDEAFCFYYEDNLEMLRRLGVEIFPFSPIKDSHLPENIQGIYLGGGYPELHVRRLSENETMKEELRRAALKGIPIIGECGGYMYLSEGIQAGDSGGRDIGCDGNKIWPMTGIVPGICRMTKKLGPFGYVTGTCRKDSFIGRAGESFLAHEFHYSEMDGGAADFVLVKSNGRRWSGGMAGGNIYAAYPHLYFCANPEIAVNFVRAMAEIKRNQEEDGDSML